MPQSAVQYLLFYQSTFLELLQVRYGPWQENLWALWKHVLQKCLNTVICVKALKQH